MNDIITNVEPKELSAYQQTYHWRNKNCAPFAYDWIKNALPGLKIEDGQQTAEIEKVSSVTGDCDLGQRKGKLLTIYDLEVEASWNGVAKDGSEIAGTLRVPEVSHEAIDGVSDYVYEFKITGNTNASSQELLAFVRKTFPSILSEKFNSFRPALVAAHGNPSDSASPAPSKPATPVPASATAPVASGSKQASEPPVKEEAAAKKEKSSVGKTVTVEVKADLQASADDLWGLLTDENKIPMWSRSAAKLPLKPEGEYELFNGNVRGKVVSIDAPKKLVQSWQVRHPAWPIEHFGTMTLSLNQGSSTTSATFTLDGVPAGTESDVEKALNTFYIQALKQMGLVSSSSSSSFPTPAKVSSAPKPKKYRKKQRRTTDEGGWSTSSLVGGATVATLSAVLIGLVYTSFPSSSFSGTK
ncbi:hypothetical protein IAR50_001973 [Cryptococcus sp. DSM 104548]